LSSPYSAFLASSNQSPETGTRCRIWKAKWGFSAKFAFRFTLGIRFWACCAGLSLSGLLFALGPLPARHLPGNDRNDAPAFVIELDASRTGTRTRADGNRLNAISVLDFNTAPTGIDHAAHVQQHRAIIRFDNNLPASHLSR